jgi:polyisoprenoid-binding protein YceI
MTFVGKSYKKVSDTRIEVTGDLTLHGKTKSVTLTLDKVGEGADPWGGYRQGWDGVLSIKRSDFGMTFMADGIGDTVTLYISVEGTRK